MTEEACLVKMFRFFDTSNRGCVDFDLFQKVLEKAGMSYPEPTLQGLFDEYDADQSGSLDYRELAFTIFRAYQENAQHDGHVHVPHESEER